MTILFLLCGFISACFRTFVDNYPSSEDHFWRGATKLLDIPLLLWHMYLVLDAFFLDQDNEEYPSIQNEIYINLIRARMAGVLGWLHAEKCLEDYWKEWDELKEKKAAWGQLMRYADCFMGAVGILSVLTGSEVLPVLTGAVFAMLADEIVDCCVLGGAVSSRELDEAEYGDADHMLLIADDSSP